jgi:AcrR family transcriptional regulator
VQQPRRGRTRSETARAAILRATRDELIASGYDKLSVDRIASAAGTGKQTIYRWYPAKSALVADCILGGYLLPGLAEVPDTGDVVADLRTWVRAFAGSAGQPGTAPLIRAAVAAAAESDEVAARLYEHVTRAVEMTLAGRLRAAGLAGQLPAGAPAAALVSQAIIGAVLYRMLTRLPLTADFADDLISSVAVPGG